MAINRPTRPINWQRDVGIPRRRTAKTFADIADPLMDDDEPESPGEIIVDIGTDPGIPDEEFSFGPGTFELVTEAYNFDGMSEDHRENLAEKLPDTELAILAGEIIDLVEQDIEDRAPWREKMTRGMSLLGLVDDEIDDGPFPGASTAVLPILLEARAQFWARAMSEMMPSDGPAKIKVVGDQTDEQEARSRRVEEYMNSEILFMDDGYYASESALYWNLPFDGSGYKKVYRDWIIDRTCSVFVSVDDMILPVTATSLRTSPRFTHRMYKTPNEVRKMQHSGFYRRCKLVDPSSESDNEVTQIKRESVGSEVEANDKSARHTIYEISIELDLPGFEDKDETGEPTGIELPYVVSIDRDSQKILAIYRNWKENDNLKRRQHYAVDYHYLPGFGPYGYGLIHCIGGLQEAATGALRVIIDGAATASMSGGFVAKDANMASKSLVFEPGVFKNVEATAEELSKAFFTPPVKGPDNALYQVLGLLTEAAQRFSSTTELQVGESNRNQPVGTTLALLEQGQKVFSSIHRGLHNSKARELRIRYDLAREYVSDDGYQYDVAGAQKEIFAADFADGLDVQPVSDPNIFSTTQKIALAQTVWQLSAEAPDIFDRREAGIYLLGAIKMPNADRFIVEEAKPMAYDPIGEAQAIMMGKPIKVMPEQPHTAYLRAHAAFLSNPQFGGNPQVAQQVAPTFMAIMGQRLAYLWMQTAMQAGYPAQPIDPETGQYLAPMQFDPAQLDQMMAQVAPALAQAPGFMPPQTEQQQGPDPATEARSMKLQLTQAEHAQKMQQAQERHALDMQQTSERAKLDLEKNIGAATLSRQERVAKALDEQAQRQFDSQAERYKSDVRMQEMAATSRLKRANASFETALKARERLAGAFTREAA